MERKTTILTNGVDNPMAGRRLLPFRGIECYRAIRREAGKAIRHTRRPVLRLVFQLSAALTPGFRAFHFQRLHCKRNAGQRLSLPRQS